MKKLISFLFISSLFFLFACGNAVKTKEDGKDDAFVAGTPDALKELNEKIAQNPDNPLLYNQRAQYYLHKENIDSAFRDINQALLLDSLNANFYVTLSDIYMAGGMVTNTLAALEKAMQIDPENIEAILKRAELHLFFEQYKEVMELTSKALDIDKVNPQAYFIRGMTYKFKGDTANAIRSIQMCVDQDQDNYHAYIQLGILYAAQNNPLAIEYYNNAINLRPRSIEALYNLGIFYQDNDMLNEALRTYTNLLQIDSTYTHAHYNIGYIHMVYLEMYREAIKHFGKAIMYNPNYIEAYYNRGYCYELLGDVHNARADYYRALDISTNYQLAIEGLNRLDRFIEPQ